MNYNKAVLFGSLAGLIGAAAWAAIAYYANYEIGYLAWGIGLAVGAATVKGAGWGNPSVATVAVVITVISIVVGKYATVELVMNEMNIDPQQMVAESIANLDDEQLTAYLADDIAAARENAGEVIPWPELNEEAETISAAYPADLWQAASHKYQGLTDDEKLAHRSQVEANIRASLVDLELWEDQVRQQNFFQSFSPMDLIFFGLAVCTAYSVGKSNEQDSPVSASEAPTTA
jgi:hypothetical protein